jgi:MSHA biogenesis protein MshL
MKHASRTSWLLTASLVWPLAASAVGPYGGRPTHRAPVVDAVPMPVDTLATPTADSVDSAVPMTSATAPAADSLDYLKAMTTSLSAVRNTGRTSIQIEQMEANPPSAGVQPPAAAVAGNAVPGGRFDLTVNNAPAAQVFNQLGAGTPYNVLVTPDVSGTISISLKNTTVTEALEALRELYGYDFKVTGNRVFVYPNTVQTRLFRIDYLPGRRQGASDVHVSSSAINQTSNGNSSGSSSSSNTSSSSSTVREDAARVRTTSDADFWKEVEASMNSLISGREGRSVVLNPAAGVIVVRATPAELSQIEGYLKAVQVSIVRQVMLEAKIVDVQLSHSSQAGVNWAALTSAAKHSSSIGVAGPGVTLGPTGAMADAYNSVVAGGNIVTNTLGKGFYGLAFQSANFAALINFLETQGEVHVLSSPRIATLNNQKAVLKVGSDELYVTGITTNQTTSGNNTTNSPTLTLTPFFSGIALDVTPEIDERGNVMLHVHPSISVVTEKQKNVDLGSLGSFTLPLATSAINETDSIVRVPNGQIVAIGGLMREQTDADRSALPGLGDVPGLGVLFRNKNTSDSKRELVILIKPTVINEDGTGWDQAAAANVPNTLLPALPQKQTQQ